MSNLYIYRSFLSFESLYTVRNPSNLIKYSTRIEVLSVMFPVVGDRVVCLLIGSVRHLESVTLS